MKAFKNILAVVAGIVAAFVLIFLVETASAKLYPMPQGIDIYNTAQMKEYIKSLPVAAYLIILAGYALGSLAGGIISTLVSGREKARSAVVVGALLLIAGLFNPDPVWFTVVSSFVYPFFSGLGFMIGRKRNDTQIQPDN